MIALISLILGLISFILFVYIFYQGLKVTIYKFSKLSKDADAYRRNNSIDKQ